MGWRCGIGCAIRPRIFHRALIELMVVFRPKLGVRPLIWGVGQVMWRTIGAAEWAVHPLNRFRGWLLVIIILLLLTILSAVTMLLGDMPEMRLYTDPMADRIIAIATLAMAVTIFVSIARRHPLTPEITAATSALGFLVQVGVDLFFDRLEADMAVDYAVSLLLMGLMLAYLFRGARPNLMFRRRLRLDDAP